MKCRDCGFEFVDDEQFCPECGSKNVVDQSKYKTTTDSKNTYYSKYYGDRNAYITFNERNIPLCILLSIVTCGIYGIVWMFSVTHDLSAATTANNDSHSIPMWPFFVTCGIYIYIWAYLCGQRIDLINERFNSQSSKYTPLIYILLEIFGLHIVVVSLIQNELNKESRRMKGLY